MSLSRSSASSRALTATMSGARGASTSIRSSILVVRLGAIVLGIGAGFFGRVPALRTAGLAMMIVGGIILAIGFLILRTFIARTGRATALRAVQIPAPPAGVNLEELVEGIHCQSSETLAAALDRLLPNARYLHDRHRKRLIVLHDLGVTSDQGRKADGVSPVWTQANEELFGTVLLGIEAPIEESGDDGMNVYSNHGAGIAASSATSGGGGNAVSMNPLSAASPHDGIALTTLPNRAKLDPQPTDDDPKAVDYSKNAAPMLIAPTQQPMMYPAPVVGPSGGAGAMAYPMSVPMAVPAAYPAPAQYSAQYPPTIAPASAPAPAAAAVPMASLPPIPTDFAYDGFRTLFAVLCNETYAPTLEYQLQAFISQLDSSPTPWTMVPANAAAILVQHRQAGTYPPRGAVWSPTAERLYKQLLQSIARAVTAGRAQVPGSPSNQQTMVVVQGGAQSSPAYIPVAVGAVSV